MRTMLVMGVALVLAGCAEVTRFKQADGDIFLVDCDSNMRLQSCRDAAESTCPSGYDILGSAMRQEDRKPVPSKSVYFKCH